MRYVLPLVLLALTAFVFAAPPAQADTITYAFTGETYGTATVPAGIAFSGTFSYSADRSDWDPTTNDGTTFNYWENADDSLVSWEITIAGTTFTRAGAGFEWLGVGDDAVYLGDDFDYFAVRGDDSRGQRFELWFENVDATVFSSPEIPTVLPFDAFSGSAGYGTFVLDLVDADDNLFLYDGYLTSLTPVPEPATLALLGAGLAGLGLHRRRRRRA